MNRRKATWRRVRIPDVGARTRLLCRAMAGLAPMIVGEGREESTMGAMVRAFDGLTQSQRVRLFARATKALALDWRKATGETKSFLDDSYQWTLTTETREGVES
jgi:hypothetical protein